MDRLCLKTLVRASLCLPGAAMALGLGNIEVNSQLNERLDAEIELVGATTRDLERLAATLASREAFAAQGVDYPSAFASIEIQPRRNEQGRAVLHVTSTRRIVEPIATLLVQADWARGRMQRTYTIFLDPPGLSSAPESAITASAAPLPAPEAPPVARPEPVAPLPRTVTSSPERPKIELGAQYGPVQRGESLWKIAVRVRPEGVGLEDTMAAIFEANPSAFAGSMDRLKQGAVLDVPATILSASRGEASSAPAVATEAAASNVQAAPASVARSDSAPSLATTDAVLTDLLPAVRRQIASTMEQNAELSEELKSLNARLASTTELLAQRDAEISRLQAQLAGLQGTPAPTVAQVAPAAAAAVSPNTVGQAAAAAAPASAPRQGLLRSMGSAFAWFGLGGLIMALALTRLRRRTPANPSLEPRVAVRREPTAPEPVATRQAPAATVQRPVPMPAAPVEVPASPSESVVPAPAASAPDAESIPDTLEIDTTEAPVLPPLTAEVAGSNNTQTVEDDLPVDPVAEADLLLAYELHSQAADLVQGGLRREPNSVALQAKLLDVYFAAENAEEYVAAARVYQTSLRENPAFWRRTVAMGRQLCPDEDLFTLAPIAQSASAEAAEGESSTAPEALILDVELDLDDESVTDEFPTVRAKIIDEAEVPESDTVVEDDEEMTARLSQPMLDADSVPPPPTPVEDDAPTDHAPILDTDTVALAAELAAAVLEDEDLQPHMVEEELVSADEDTVVSSMEQPEPEPEPQVDNVVSSVEVEDESTQPDTEADTVMSPASVMVGDRLSATQATPPPAEEATGAYPGGSDNTTRRITMELVGLERRDEDVSDEETEEEEERAPVRAVPD